MSLSEKTSLPSQNEATSAERTLLIYDKNPLLSEVLCNRLEDLLAFDCAFVTNRNALFEAVERQKPSILIVDPTHLSLSNELDICDFMKSIRRASPETWVLAYSFKVNATMVKGCLEAGLRGCVAKKSKFQQLEIALAVVIDGGVYFDGFFANELSSIYAEPTENSGLSEREKSVLVGVARGLSSKQIAHDLKISNKTVDTYKARAIQKLDLTNKEKLVSYVLDQGWMN